MRCALIAVLLAAGWAATAQAAWPRSKMLAVDLAGSRIEGLPLYWSTSQVDLLARDGRLWSFSPATAKNSKEQNAPFRSLSFPEVRDRIGRELGPTFEVTGTGHYLVAHPRGQKDLWSPRFEELYRSFMHYFSVRGFTIREPEFPLVAIVWKNEQEFIRYANNDGTSIVPGTLGYYSPTSNRITLFDVGNGDKSAAAWEQNAETIIHEATHQTAFNTGVHKRFAQSPRWLVEGLGTMFEAPGVWNSRAKPLKSDRLNRGRLSEFQRLSPSFKQGFVAEFVSDDRMFRSDVNRAYATAWALSFYLVETRPQKYSQFLAMTATRPDFSAYPAAERLKDFVKVFGADPAVLEAQFLKFMREIK